MTKAIILARVSTKEQEETGLSIEKIQLPLMREYAADNDMEVVREFTFQETASDKLRKQFDEMVEYVKNSSEIKVVIAFRVDRMTRNYRDAVEMDVLRTEYNKDLHFVNDRLVLTAKSVGRDIQDWDMKVFLAKQHINRCQEDAHNTLMSKMRTGEQYGRAPFGYRNAHDTAKRSVAVVEPFEAGIVRKVFDLYTTGADSYLSIANKLNKEFPSLKFSKRKVEHIIKNPYYHGDREYDGQIYPHDFEKIIDKEVYELAAEKREGRRKTQQKGKFAAKTGIYRGLIYCADCGCAYSPSPNRHTRLGRDVQSETYYYCTNSKRVHKTKPQGTNDYELNEQFGEIFKRIKIPQEDLDRLVTTLRSSHEGKVEFTKNEVSHCRTQIDKYQNRIEKAYEDKLDGSITTEQYDKLRKQWTQKKQEFQDKLERIDKADEEYYITASYLLELASRSYELFMGSEPEQKRQIIGLTLQNLKIKDGKVLYDWIKPFDSIFESVDRHTWGDWRDSNPRPSVPQTDALTN